MINWFYGQFAAPRSLKVNGALNWSSTWLKMYLLTITITKTKNLIAYDYKYNYVIVIAITINGLVPSLLKSNLYFTIFQSIGDL